MADAPHSSSEFDNHSHGQKSGGHRSHGGGGGHGPSAPHEEPHEGAPEWLISFADMVMLMMGFFVILFALNVNPSGRQPGGSAPEGSGAPAEGLDSHMLDLMIAIREAFNNPVDIRSTNPQEQAMVRRIIERMGKSEAKTDGIEGRDQDVQSIRPGEYHARAGSIQFGDDSTTLTQAANRTLDDVAEKVRGLNLVIEVRGHVSAAEAFGNTERAMRLALERAMAVGQGLADRGVDWWQLRLVACADNDRLIALPDNRTDDSANSRVEVIITDEVVPVKVPTRPPLPSAMS